MSRQERLQVLREIADHYDYFAQMHTGGEMRDYFLRRASALHWACMQLQEKCPDVAANHAS